MLIAEGIFDRWYIFADEARRMAWSGKQWVATLNGIPTGGIQICNFKTEAEAREYARQHQSDFR